MAIRALRIAKIHYPGMQKKRPPVVVVMGHIDHGKSTLLDYIRKSNSTAKEAGGITQHISAYVVEHPNEKGIIEPITFLDTPGHAAFTNIRERGAQVADIAILVVSAEDSVKAQTLEALETIKTSGVPYIVAINKIDKPAANPEKTKIDLSEAGVYLEGYGGDVPYAEISAKSGAGIPHLLELILIVAELAQFTYDDTKLASGAIIESRRDAKRGVSATLMIKDGTLKKGMVLCAGQAIAGTRILENYFGKNIDEASAGTPVIITGWSELPQTGAIFQAFATKKEAEKFCSEVKKPQRATQVDAATGTKIIPLILKADTAGSLEAIEKEVGKIVSPDIAFKIIGRGIGDINEFDMKLAGSNGEAMVIGFHVKADSNALAEKDKQGTTLELFDIIYKLTERLAEELEKRRPRKQIEEVVGTIKVLKTFSRTKEKQVVGGRVLSGKAADKAKVRILRRDEEIARGEIVGLEQMRAATKEVAEGGECGIMVEAKAEIAPGDVLECIVMVTK